jgi:GTP pyrophosphokinase
VYTPKGDIKMLPVGASALDFAFHVHSAVGVKCIGAKVNHKLVPIGHKLRSGDQIEIITSAKQKPNAEWLNFVITTKARAKIKDSLRDEKRQIADLGKDILERKFSALKVPMNSMNLDEVANFYKYGTSLDFLYDVAIKKLDPKEIKTFTVQGERLIAPKPVRIAEEKNEPAEWKDLSKKDGGELIIFGESSDKIKYTLANCCKPIPGDDVFGFVSAGEGLKIHRTNCPNATRLLANYGHRVVKTKWAKNKEISFLTGLRIIGLDDVGVIHKITNLISGDLRINIAAMTIEAKEGIFEGNVKVFVKDKEQLEDLVQHLLQLSGIERVERYNPDERNQNNIQ